LHAKFVKVILLFKILIRIVFSEVEVLNIFGDDELFGFWRVLK